MMYTEPPNHAVIEGLYLDHAAVEGPGWFWLTGFPTQLEGTAHRDTLYSCFATLMLHSFVAYGALTIPLKETKSGFGRGVEPSSYRSFGK